MTDREIALFLDDHPDFYPEMCLMEDGGFSLIPPGDVILVVYGVRGPSGNLARLNEIEVMMAADSHKAWLRYGSESEDGA